MPSGPRFLEELAARGEEPLLRNVNGTIRFDLRSGAEVDSWTVAIADGAVSMTHRRVAADCVAAMDEDTFESITTGTMNAFAAALRGDIELSGDPAILLAFGRIFPGPLLDDRRRTEAVEGSP